MDGKRLMNGLLACAILLALAGCDRPSLPDGSGSRESATVYQVTGTIRKIKPEENLVVIDHDEIPNYMKAMVMPFAYKDPAALGTAKAGDRVEFDYIVQESGAWIENVEVQP